MAEITLKINGMFCGGCAKQVRAAIRSVPGVKAVEVSLSEGWAEVVYDSRQADASRMMGAVAAAGYDALPVGEPGGFEPDRTPTLEELVSASPLLRPILAALAGAASLVVLYVAIISIAESPAHAFDQLNRDTWFVAAAALAFGAQVGLFFHLRWNIRQRATAALPAGSGGVSTAAMVACCAHHLAEVLPFLGLSAAAIFLNQYRGWFMAAGLVMSASGIAIMLLTIRKVERAQVLG